MAERADQELQALYVRLYCDEDVSAGIVENLRQRGFDILSARDADRLHLDDAAQLAFAVAEQRALLTHNRYDFEQAAHALSGGRPAALRHHPGDAAAE